MESGQLQTEAGKVSRVIYIPMYFPVLYQTFLRREIAGLEEAGCEVTVVPCLPGGDRRVEHSHFVYRPGWAWLWAPWEWLCCYGLHPSRTWRGVKQIIHHPPHGLESWFFLVWSVCFAPVLAREARRWGVEHVHGAWATAPATVAWLLHHLMGVPFSFGAQAYDLYRGGGDNFLVSKMKAAKFVHTTTRTNVTTLSQRCPEHAAKVLLARRGLAELPPPRLKRNEDKSEIRILSVGRLVPKKGHMYQLQASRILKDRGYGVALKCVGDGPLRDELQRQVDLAGLTDEVEFCGAAQPSEVAQYYAWADIFWHTGVVDEKGDRDGLPNVVPEAMANGVPVISGTEVGVLEAVQDGVTGVVVDVTDPILLADAVERLIKNSKWNEELCLNARAWVEEHFLASKNAARIAEAIKS
ncbi:MAG: glycosyltransferase family 4 protein [Candidatus Methylacidiphilales bacterium]